MIWTSLSLGGQMDREADAGNGNTLQPEMPYE